MTGSAVTLRQPTPLIGRQRLVADVRARLLRERVALLTLTGPGGSGKTRLALAVAEAAESGFAHGVEIVDLSPLRDPRLVVSSIAAALGVPEGEPRTLSERIQRALRDRQTLVVLDNFEQVLAAAPAVGELLGLCPGLQLLVTSRAPLRLRWEHEQPVPPLALPDRHRLPPPDRLARVPAVALFVERARAARSDFRLTAANAPAVAAICARLDGLPLALELAAARCKVLPPPALLARLERRQEALTGGARDHPDRHRSLAAAIDWSHDLLGDAERTLFRRLCVCAGGCTAEMAEAVAGVTGAPAHQALESLVDMSLVGAEPEPEPEPGRSYATGRLDPGTFWVWGPRFRMLETVREFAAERLVAAGESDATYRRLATACLALAEQAGAELRGADQGAWLARLEREHDNFRAVLTWALSPVDGAPSDGRLEIALRLGGALWRFWFMRGDLLEGEHWLETALARVHAVAESPQPPQHAPPVPAAVRASAHTGAGEMAWGRGDIERARRHHEAALALRRALDDPDGVAQSLHNLGNLALERGDYGQARALHEEALAIRRARGSPRDVALSLRNLGRLAALRGEYGTAHILLEESLRLAAQVGGNLSRAWPLHALGELALLEGDAAAAAGAFAESLALARAVGLKEAVGALEGIALAVPWAGRSRPFASSALPRRCARPSGPRSCRPSGCTVRRPWPGYGPPWVSRPSPPPGPPAGAWGWTRRSRRASPWRLTRASRRRAAGRRPGARRASQSAGARGGGADRAGLLQPGDRRAPGDHGRDGHQPRHPHPEQARPALPDANRRLGVGLPGGGRPGHSGGPFPARRNVSPRRRRM